MEEDAKIMVAPWSKHFAMLFGLTVFFMLNTSFSKLKNIYSFFINIGLPTPQNKALH